MPEKTNSKNADGIFEPLTVEEVPWETFSHGRFGMRFKQLGEFGGASKLGVCFEELQPKQQANQAHYHLLEEEHIFMLEGELTLRLNEKEFILKPDHYVCFPAGQECSHAIINHTDKLCRYLIFSDRDKNDVAVFPDSDKVKVGATREIYQKSRTLDYWDGAE